MTRISTEDIRSVDRELLAAMRFGQCMGIGELTEQLGVTATAVRQRVDRLLEKGLLERDKVVSGRGRPTFCYQLTLTGHRLAGADSSDLADALWRELLAIEDETLREKILHSVARRLGKQYADQASLSTPVANQSDSFEDRLKRLSELMSESKIPIEVSKAGQMPVLDISTCPYPSLTDRSDDRAMCRLEEQMISEALGQQMHLSSCRLDGDSCCQFSATNQESSTLPATSFASEPSTS